jgi:ABC-type amino acid transport substrate-binding protein
MRVARLAAVLVTLGVAVAIVVVTVQGTGDPSRRDLLEQAGLVGKRELLVGVRDDIPGIALVDQKTGKFSGFDVDIAYLIAADLGFQPDEVRFLPIEAEDRARMQARGPDGVFVTVDLVVATFSISEEREKQPGVSFSAPYLNTEQTVMTRADHPSAEAMSDFRGEKMCIASTTTSGNATATAGVELVRRNRISSCVAALRAGEVDAVTNDAAVLAGFVARDRDRLRLHDVGIDAQESYGINTGENEALRTLVNLSLFESSRDPQDHRWEEAFDRHLRSEQDAAQEQQVAIGKQPSVPPVKVRQWPWERLDAAASPRG